MEIIIDEMDSSRMFGHHGIGGNGKGTNLKNSWRGSAIMAWAILLSLLSSFCCEAFTSPSTSCAIQRGDNNAYSNFHNNQGYNSVDLNLQTRTPKAHGISKSRRMGSRSTSLYFFGRNRNNEEKDTIGKANDENEEENKGFDFNGLQNLSIESIQESIQEGIPSTFSFLKVAFPSFLAGGVVTLSVLFLPLISEYYDAFNPSSIYGSSSQTSNSGNSASLAGDGTGAANGKRVNNINQPVILFETILSDLDAAYVDDVDIQKLFETGVKAMTSSLDPYTEFESRQEAVALEESVSGKYGGVGLVIRGNVALGEADKKEAELLLEGLTPVEGERNEKSGSKQGSKQNGPPIAVKDGKDALELSEEEADLAERRRILQKSMQDGIRVVSAFEGYAYDAGLRVGDKLLAVDDFPITPTTSVEDVRNHLRGDPGTTVSITFLREGVGSNSDSNTGTSQSKVNEPQTVILKRSIVRIPDVKYFGFLGDPKDKIGYIDLSGFANDAGREVRFAIRALQHGADLLARQEAGEDLESVDVKANLISPDRSQLKGLVLDLRSNPGGLLTSAVDVATLFVPNGSDIVSAKGRGFPETLYRSKSEPALDPTTRLAVLVNEQTASAAEIVTGAIQDLDVGVVVGKGRTFGKGLVQNVQDLPYQTALKFTVAKYYTPSGRCIQSTVYKEGGRGEDLLSSSSSDSESFKKGYKATKVLDKDRSTFYTTHGRQVKDGGGIEVDYKVEPQKASATEIVLLNSGAYADFAAEWSRTHELTEGFRVDDTTYKEFQKFVEQRQKTGDLKLELLYDNQLKDLQKKLRASGFDSSSSSLKELDKLRADIIKDIKRDFVTYKDEIREDVEQNILARYLPESMLIEKGLRTDVQVMETARMLKDGKEFDRILVRDGDGKVRDVNKNKEEGFETASSLKPEPKLQTRWQE